MKKITYIAFYLLLLCCSKPDIKIEPGTPSILKTYKGYAYLATGEQGLQVINLSTKAVKTIIHPSLPSESVDDLCIADNLLFLLDARGNGFLTVYSLTDPGAPQLISGPSKVPVGPYSGVSAANGEVVVSGGVHYLLHKTYSTSGKLSAAETIYLGDQGHPDVLLSNTDNIAFVSTHFEGPRFGMIALKLNDYPIPPALISAIDIDQAGFTTGTVTPSGFPIKSAIQDSIVFVAHGGGLSILALENNKLANLKNLEIGIEAVNIALLADTAYIIGSNPQPALVKVDISDTQNPKVISTDILNTITPPTGISVTDDYILIAANEDGLIILNH